MEIKPLPRRHYQRAPITEAVISIGYELPTEIGLEGLLKVSAELKSDYPGRAPHFTLRIEVKPEEMQGGTGPPQVVGYQLASQDGKRFVRLTLSDFTFSQLAPYDRWETLRTEAKRIWTVLETVFQPQRITRASVRYINRIDIPNPNGSGIDLDVYFRAAPKIPPELPQAMSGYFVRLQLPFREPNGSLVIIMAAAPPPSPDLVSAVLDLDAIMTKADMDVASAWETIEELRDVKNAAFEASITDAARELFR